MRKPDKDSNVDTHLTVKEAAELAGRSTAWVYDRLADGRMSGMKASGRILVSRTDLERQRRLDRSPAVDTAAARRHKKALQLRSAFRLITNDAK